MEADVLEADSLHTGLKSVHTACCLIHSMGTGGDFEDDDRRGGSNFAAAAREPGVQRIVDPGGLGDEQETLSKHLLSRQEVRAIPQESGAQVIEFRASIIIGSGSLSFELVQKLPVIIWLKWVVTEASAIATGDTIDGWRVEQFKPNRRLRLSAAMKQPGRAWLELDV